MPGGIVGASSPTRPAPTTAGVARLIAGVGVGRQVVLRCRERRRLRVRGPVTGKLYEFAADLSGQPVDARDADVLLRTGQFVRVAS